MREVPKPIWKVEANGSFFHESEVENAKIWQRLKDFRSEIHGTEFRDLRDHVADSFTYLVIKLNDGV